jgi:hypothetical protein
MFCKNVSVLLLSSGLKRKQLKLAARRMLVQLTLQSCIWKQNISLKYRHSLARDILMLEKHRVAKFICRVLSRYEGYVIKHNVYSEGF